MQVLEVRFRVSVGEEFSAARMDAFDDMAVAEGDVSSDEAGEVLVRLRFEDDLDEAQIENEIEEFAEDMAEATGDMDLLDFDYVEED